jgi:hypothetical protein
MMESGEFQVGFVVDEFGKVVVNSVVVVPDPELATTRRTLLESAQGARFRPGRVGECWVPARFIWTVSQPLGGVHIRW